MDKDDVLTKMSKEVEKKQYLDLVLREVEWLKTIMTSKISADQFYFMHRNSSLGEASYRNYILEKIEFIKKYTSEDNFYIAFKAILLGNNCNYDVPIEFTRHLIKSIEERCKKAFI